MKDHKGKINNFEKKSFFQGKKGEFPDFAKNFPGEKIRDYSTFSRCATTPDRPNQG